MSCIARDDCLPPFPFRLLSLLAAVMMAMALAATLTQAAERDFGGAGAVEPDAERRQSLVRMVRHDCGSCHGLTLAGGLGPALTPAALAYKSPHYLKLIILYGRNGSPMPAWRPLLSEADAEWIAAQLLKGFPDAR